METVTNKTSTEVMNNIDDVAAEIEAANKGIAAPPKKEDAKTDKSPTDGLIISEPDDFDEISVAKVAIMDFAKLENLVNEVFENTELKDLERIKIYRPNQSLPNGYMFNELTAIAGFNLDPNPVEGDKAFYGLVKTEYLDNELDQVIFAQKNPTAPLCNLTLDAKKRLFKFADVDPNKWDQDDQWKFLFYEYKHIVSRNAFGQDTFDICGIVKLNLNKIISAIYSGNKPGVIPKRYNIFFKGMDRTGHEWVQIEEFDQRKFNKLNNINGGNRVHRMSVFDTAMYNN